MIFFSGFGFQNEETFFEDYLNVSRYTVSGFSYGAQKAVDHAVTSNNRVDTLQLFSPAFFQRLPEKFKNAQIKKFQKNSSSYILNFRNDCLHGLNIDNYSDYFTKADEDDLIALLDYNFSSDKLKKIVDKGIKIEVYLGNDDKIIDVAGAKDFFVNYATIYTIKDANHILQKKD